MHGCAVNGAKDANPIRQIALFILDPRPRRSLYPEVCEGRLRGNDEKEVIWLKRLNNCHFYLTRINLKPVNPDWFAGAIAIPQFCYRTVEQDR